MISDLCSACVLVSGLRVFYGQESRATHFTRTSCLPHSHFSKCWGRVRPHNESATFLQGAECKRESTLLLGVCLCRRISAAAWHRHTLLQGPLRVTQPRRSPSLDRP